MLRIKLKKGDSIVKALKLFKQKTKKTKLIKEVRERRYYEKPSVARRKQKQKAIRINKWKLKNEEL